MTDQDKKHDELAVLGQEEANDKSLGRAEEQVAKRTQRRKARRQSHFTSKKRLMKQEQLREQAVMKNLPTKFPRASPRIPSKEERHGLSLAAYKQLENYLGHEPDVEEVARHHDAVKDFRREWIWRRDIE
jgi:hypothetical protein